MATLVIVVSAVLVLLCRQTDRQTDADERFTPATLMKHDVNVDFSSKSAS